MGKFSDPTVKSIRKWFMSSADKPKNPFSHALIFDTNVFKNITRKGNEAKFSCLFTSFNVLYNDGGKYDSFLNAITPFLFLEYVGQTAPKFDHTSIGDLKAEKTHDALSAEVFDKALSFYEGSEVLSVSNLRKKHEENLQYISETGMKLFEDIVGGIAKKDTFDDLLKKNLALDFTYRFPFQKFLMGDELLRVHINSQIDVYRAHMENVNLTQVRGIFRLVEDLKKRTKGKALSEEALNVFKAVEGIKEFKDLADLDLIQMGCLGAFLEEKKMPVIAFTSDPKESVFSRVQLFKSTFLYFDTLLQEKKLFEGLDYIEQVDILPGIFLFVDSESGKIIDTLEVDKVPTADEEGEAKA